jgi:hypothetical protein
MVIPELPLHWRMGGTLVIPWRGRVADQGDLLQYRDMITIIRDRVQSWINEGKTLAQIQSLAPAADYAPRFGSTAGEWTTDKFVEAIYRSLQAKKK